MPYPGDALALASQHLAHSISPAEALALAAKHVAGHPPPTSPFLAPTSEMLPDPSPAVDALAVSVSDQRFDIESLQEHNVQLTSMVALLTEQVAAVAAIVPTISPPAPGSVSSGAMSPRELRSGNSCASLFSCTTIIAEMPLGGNIFSFFPSTFSCTTHHAEMPLFPCTNLHAEIPLASYTFCPPYFFSTTHPAETYLAFDHTISFSLLAPPPAAHLQQWPRHQLAESDPLPTHAAAAVAPPACGTVSAPLPLGHQSFRPHLMSPAARRFHQATPQPHTSVRRMDVAFESSRVRSSTSSEAADTALVKFLTTVKVVSFNGARANWPPFEEGVRTFLRQHGIVGALSPGYLDADRNPQHNEALHSYISSCVSSTASVYAVFRRAPSGDGHTAHCYLSGRYGILNPVELAAQLFAFTPFDAETPIDLACRLGDLFDQLDDAGKPQQEWEKIAKLLLLLEAYPKDDFGHVASRIEEAAETRGILYTEACAWVSNRVTTLDMRSAYRDIVPRTRPVFKTSVNSASATPGTISPASETPGTISPAPAPVPSEAPPPSMSSSSAPDWKVLCAEMAALREQSRQVLLAATHRHQPPLVQGEPTPRRPPKEKCTQTPGLRLKREAGPCRADGCETPSRSRLCEECNCKLVAKKVKFLPCTTEGVTRYAYYVVQAPQGSQPAWRGILMKSELDHLALQAE